MLSKTEIEESVAKVEWFIKYTRNVGVGTDSARTMQKAVEALIPCGMMPSAAIGVLHTGTSEDRSPANGGIGKPGQLSAIHR